MTGKHMLGPKNYLQHYRRPYNLRPGRSLQRFFDNNLAPPASRINVNRRGSA